LGVRGLKELEQIVKLLDGCGYGTRPRAVRHRRRARSRLLHGPVFEAQLTFPVRTKRARTVVFGSVAGGGRYDDLVARFTGQQVPATGVSIGVSRADFGAGFARPVRRCFRPWSWSR
jgi:histidyl-tRNA synthetase